jgi:hypothetical protein
LTFKRQRSSAFFGGFIILVFLGALGVLGGSIFVLVFLGGLGVLAANFNVITSLAERDPGARAAFWGTNSKLRSPGG